MATRDMKKSSRFTESGYDFLKRLRDVILNSCFLKRKKTILTFPCFLLVFLGKKSLRFPDSGIDIILWIRMLIYLHIFLQIFARLS